MLHLILHPPPEPLREEVGTHGVSGGVELNFDPIMVVLLQQVLALMRGARDVCLGETRDERDERREKERIEKNTFGVSTVPSIDS